MIGQNHLSRRKGDIAPGKGTLKRLFPAILLFISNLLMARDTLQVLILPIESPRIMYGRFLPLKRYLENSTGAALELSIPRSMEEISRKFARGEVDVAFLCPVLYCQLRARFPVEPLVTLRREGKITTTSVTVVRDDSPVRVLADLKEHTFAYGKYQCAASGLVPRVMIQSAGLLPEDFLEVARLGSDESALYAVLARLYDATAVSRRVARQYLPRGLRIIRESFPIPNNLIAVHAHLSPEMRFRLQQAFLELDTLRHADILKNLGDNIDGFVAVQDSDYHTVRLLLRSVESETAPREVEVSAVRVGAPPFFTTVTMYRQFDPLLKQWEKHTGRRFFLEVPESMEAYLRRLRAGEYDVAIVSSPLWKALTGTPYHKDTVLPASQQPFPERRGVWITRADSPIRRLQDLGHRHVAAVSRWSISGYLSQQSMLQAHGIRWDNLRVEEVGTHERVLLLVYSGEVDAGAVSAGVLKLLKNDVDTTRIRILARCSGEEPWYVVVHSRVSSVVKFSGL